MARVRTLHRRPRSKPVAPQLKNARGSALLEFAITLPLLVVFVVGIYDFSGAFNQKQKIEQAAQEGAIIAGAQPMNDIQSTSSGPASLQPVVSAVLNSLTGSGVVASGTCGAPVVTGPGTGTAGLTWTYTISGCSAGSDQLIVTINRGWVGAAQTTAAPVAVGTIV